MGAPPSYDPIHKTPGTNVQSSNQNWNPSGGYNTHNQPYNPPVGGGSHTPYGSPSYPQPNAPPYQNPSYNSQPHAPPYQNPSYNSQPHAPQYQNPSYNQGYNSHPYNPSYSPQGPPMNAPPPYNPYNPSMGHSYSPGVGYNPPVGHTPQTVIVQSESHKPGLGQLAKEAFVYAGVNAGVNAAVNRILPGGISGHNYNYPSSGTAPVNNGVVPPVSHTQITYNNYYNNGTSVPAPSGQPTSASSSPQPSVQPSLPTQLSSTSQPSTIIPSDPKQDEKSLANTTQTSSSVPPPPAPLDENQFPSPSGAIITKSDVQQLTEDLFENDKNNAYKYITVQLQGQKMDDSVKDDAPEP